MTTVTFDKGICDTKLTIIDSIIKNLYQHSSTGNSRWESEKDR